MSGDFPQSSFCSPGCWGWASSGAWGAPLCCTAQTPPCANRCLSESQEAAPGPAAQYWQKVTVVRKRTKTKKQRDEEVDEGRTTGGGRGGWTERRNKSLPQTIRDGEKTKHLKTAGEAAGEICWKWLRGTDKRGRRGKLQLDSTVI